MSRAGYSAAALVAGGVLTLALVASAQAQQPAPAARPKRRPAAQRGEPVAADGAPIGQKTIVDAVWAALSQGDPTPLAAIGRQLPMLTGELRAYVLAAGREGQRVYKDLQKFIKDFDAKERDAQRRIDEQNKTGEEIAGKVGGLIAVVATAAATANAVPIVGQVVSAVLALGLAIATAITEGFKIEKRSGADQVRDAYEGITVFLGLGAEAPTGPYEDALRELKSKVTVDPVAFALPLVPPRTAFPFAPTYNAFREAARELHLYPEGGTNGP